MIVLLFIYFILIFYKLRISPKGNTDYLSIENTTAIKGVFILMVFLSHFNSYISLSSNLDKLYFKFFSFIGQAMVSMFLFYSGYGIMESIKRKGSAYILSIPKKRLLHTLFNFDCAVLFYLILGLILGSKYSARQIVLSFLGWDSLGNSNWYIFVILLLYLLTFIIFKLFSNAPQIISVVVLGITVCALIIITYHFNLREVHWYDTAACYVFGMVYSLYKEKIETILNKNVFIYFVSFLAVLGLFIFIKNRRILFEIIANLLFSALIVLASMKITFKNKVLLWFGDHLFEVYILQRLPMILFSQLGFLDFNIYLYFLLCFSTTILLSIGFRYLTSSIYKRIIK